MAETQEGYPSKRNTEGDVPRAEFSKTGAEISCNDGQEAPGFSEDENSTISRNKGGLRSGP